MHGWFTCLFPVYMKTYFADEPIFNSSKIVTSVYSKDFDNYLSKKLKSKVEFDGIPSDLIDSLNLPTYETLINIAIKSSDGVVISSEKIDEKINDLIEKSEKPTLRFDDFEKENAIVNFYNSHII